MLKELCCTAMLLTAGANLYARSRSLSRNRRRSFISTVQNTMSTTSGTGKRLYSLAKTYGVAEQVIAAENPQLAQGSKRPEP